MIRTAALVGAVLGAAMPFVAGGASVAAYTDMEARIGFGLLAAVVYALLGAAAGWALATLATGTWRDGLKKPGGGPTDSRRDGD